MVFEPFWCERLKKGMDFMEIGMDQGRDSVYIVSWQILSLINICFSVQYAVARQAIPHLEIQNEKKKKNFPHLPMPPEFLA